MATRKSIVNYTTSIEADKTAAEVTRLLWGAGASTVSIDQEARVPVRVRFAMPTPRGEGYFAVPARIDRVHAVLLADLKLRKIPKSLATREQAARVAWRILKARLETELALVEHRLEDVDEVLMPYLSNGKGTYFEHYVETLAALPATNDRVR